MKQNDLYTMLSASSATSSEITAWFTAVVLPKLHALSPSKMLL
jgi:hypothetical protein